MVHLKARANRNPQPVPPMQLRRPRRRPSPRPSPTTAAPLSGPSSRSSTPISRRCRRRRRHPQALSMHVYTDIHLYTYIEIDIDRHTSRINPGPHPTRAHNTAGGYRTRDPRPHTGPPPHSPANTPSNPDYDQGGGSDSPRVNF